MYCTCRSVPFDLSHTKRAISNGHTRHTAALHTDSFQGGEGEPALLPRHT